MVIIVLSYYLLLPVSTTVLPVSKSYYLLLPVSLIILPTVASEYCGIHSDSFQCLAKYFDCHSFVTFYLKTLKLTMLY